jgi:hypothetical protein
MSITNRASPTTDAPTHTAYRFTVDDEQEIIGRLTLIVRGWRRSGGPRDEAADQDCLLRLGAHAIGCRVADLRDVEMEWMQDQVKAALRRTSVPELFNLMDLTAGLAEEKRKGIETAYAQAMAYVWGRQDAGESTKDTAYSLAFAAAFATRKHAYLTEQVWTMPNLHDAFVEWRESGIIS